MKNELLKTKSDVFDFLFDQKSLFLYKAQEAEDLGNPAGAAELKALADQVGVVTKRLVSEIDVTATKGREGLEDGDADPGAFVQEAPRNETVSLWGRLGISLEVAPEELAVLKGTDVDKAQDLLIDLVRSDRCTMSGETYFPEEANEEYIGDMEDELAFHLDCDLHSASGRSLRTVSVGKIAAAEQCLVDNGIEPDEAGAVLQALGYVLLDAELYPEGRSLDAQIGAAEAQKVPVSEISAREEQTR